MWRVSWSVVQGGPSKSGPHRPAALQAEDIARLSAVERAVRKVARMILTPPRRAALRRAARRAGHVRRRLARRANWYMTAHHGR